MTWRDVTSRQRGEVDSEPRTWETTVGSIRVSVTRHIDFPGRWILRCVGYGADYVDLGACPIDQAKHKALAILAARLRDDANAADRMRSTATAKADERELYVVEYHEDDRWHSDSCETYKQKEYAENSAALMPVGGLPVRVTRYLPEDPAALVRAKLEATKEALRRVRLVNSNVEVMRADLVPGLAMAAVELERVVADLRRQLTPTDSSIGKGTP